MYFKYYYLLCLPKRSKINVAESRRLGTTKVNTRNSEGKEIAGSSFLLYTCSSALKHYSHVLSKALVH
ncbi:hypothetical protein QTP88_022002 [Uroleucon formosanum]